MSIWCVFDHAFPIDRRIYVGIYDSQKKSPNSFCGALLYPSDGSVADSETEELVKWIGVSIFGGTIAIVILNVVSNLCPMPFQLGRIQCVVSFLLVYIMNNSTEVPMRSRSQ